MAKTVCTRTSTQCRSHAQKFIVSLEKQGKNLEYILENDFFNSLGDDALNMDDNSRDDISENFKSFKFKNSGSAKPTSGINITIDPA